MSAHLVPLDFTVLEVCFGVGVDKDATTLPKKSEHVTFQRGAGGKVQEGFRYYGAHAITGRVIRNRAISEVRSAINSNSPSLHTTRAKDVTFQRGAGRRVQKVQNASTTLEGALFWVMVQLLKFASPPLET